LKSQDEQNNSIKWLIFLIALVNFNKVNREQWWI